MNISSIAPVLVTIVAAQRQGDTQPDVARIALMSMLIRPPAGLLLALIMAQQAAPAAAAVTANSSANTSKATSRGADLYDAVAPRTQQNPRLFPNFLGRTRQEASDFAHQLGLNERFEDPGASGRELVVVAQHPRGGQPWHDETHVRLTLGPHAQ